MKLILTTILYLCICPSVFSQVVEPLKITPPDKYDEWGDIQFSDETAHLNKIANQLKEWKLSIVYLVIYAGQTACKGEAIARGTRAKTYLLEKGVDPWRVEWIDGGWKKELSVDVWIWPPEFKRTVLPIKATLKPNQVKIDRTCKIKYRGGSRRAP